jgi:hypothetical protein
MVIFNLFADGGVFFYERIMRWKIDRYWALRWGTRVG